MVRILFRRAEARASPRCRGRLLHALLGIGLVSGGTAAMNEVIERDLDALMRRTARRPLVTGSMSVAHATVGCPCDDLGGTAYLALATNWLTAALTLATSVVYLAAYTPLKKVAPVCTFVGAFPGAMPPVLGWTAIRGTTRLGSAGTVRHPVLLAVPALPLHCACSIAKITSERTSACCPWWSQMDARPPGRSCCIRRR